jgi:hypothetical protein
VVPSYAWTKRVQTIFEAVKTHPGEEVEFLGDARDKSKNEHNERENDKGK